MFGYIAQFHNWILSWNNQSEQSFTDKELHFIVIGILGMLLFPLLLVLLIRLNERGVLRLWRETDE